MDAGERPAVIPLGWLTAHDVSKIYRVSVQYARKMAHQHRWRRIRCGQRVGYHLDDVEAWSDTRET